MIDAFELVLMAFVAGSSMVASSTGSHQLDKQLMPTIVLHQLGMKGGGQDRTLAQRHNHRSTGGRGQDRREE
jgi:hypothetical protein